MKKCTKCNQIKPFESFSKRKASKDGLQYKCKICDKKISAEWLLNNYEHMRKLNANWYAKNAEHDRNKTKEWRNNNPEKTRLQNLRYRTSKAKNGVYKISKKYLLNLYSSSCYVCGSKSDIEVDHIIPISRGGTHSEGNLQPLCRSCNASKGAKTMSEWLLG